MEGTPGGHSFVVLIIDGDLHAESESDRSRAERVLFDDLDWTTGRDMVRLDEVASDRDGNTCERAIGRHVNTWSPDVKIPARNVSPTLRDRNPTPRIGIASLEMVLWSAGIWLTGDFM